MSFIKGRSKGEILFTIICILIVIGAIVVLSIVLIGKQKVVNQKAFSTTDTYIGNTVGNTIANIRYNGYCAMEDKWIYYYTSNDDFTKQCIYRIKNNGRGKKLLFEDNIEIHSINALNGYIYFIGIIDGDYSSSDKIDNKIYRMKNNGSNLEVINDNSFNNNSYAIYAVKDKIYYIGIDYNIYKMNLDGTNPELVSKTGTGFLGVTEKYIIYDVPIEGEEESFETWIMDLDGNNAKVLIPGLKLTHVNIENDNVYYLEDDSIFKININTGETKDVLYSGIYLLNVYNNYAYFFSYIDDREYRVGLYRMNLIEINSEAELLKTLGTTSYYLDVVRDYANFLDTTNNSVIVNLLKTDGSLKNFELFSYDKADVIKYYDE